MAGTVIEELVALLGWDLTGEEDLKRFKKGLRDAERGLESFARQASLFAAAAATAFAGAMTVFGKSVISTSANFEQMTATLETIEGSSEKAKQSMDWVAEFAKTTPYELDQVASSFVRLRAYGLDPMDGTLRAVGDAASAMGKDLMSGVEAIADAATGENERLKEFGITASVAGNQVTYAWQQNGEQMTRTVKKNGVEITKTLTDIFNRRFGGAMDKQSKTWNGMWSNMLDTWTGFQKKVGDKGFFDSMKDRLGGLLDYIGQLDREGKLDQWAQSISDGLTKAADVVGYVIDRIVKNFNTIRDFIKDHQEDFDKFKGFLVAIAFWLFPVASFLFLAALAIDDFLTHLRGGDSVLSDFIDWLADFLDADPEKVAEVLGDMAKNALKLAGAAAGIVAVSSALRKLAGAVGLFGAGSTAAGGASILGWLLPLLGGTYVGSSLKQMADDLAAPFRSEEEKEADRKSLQSTIDKIDEIRLREGKDPRGDVWKNIQSEGFWNWLDRKFNGNDTKASRPRGFDERRFDNSPVSGSDDLAQKLQNFAANMNKASGDGAAANVNNTMNDNRVTNQTFNNTVNQTVTQAAQAPEAAARATNDAVSRNLKGLDPARMNGGGGF
ncbi:MAG: tape measure protein [Martelella sp.]|uniref:tape measure protein n=1 Tax=Martelella sp. TaxID=1969699 RepID=UPI003241E590